MDLALVRRKLDRRNTLHYFTVEQFVDDVLLMLRNCATFNYVSPSSEVSSLRDCVFGGRQWQHLKLLLDSTSMRK